MPMRSDAVIFVNTQLLKSVGAYFFRSAGPWDCEASAIARSSKASSLLLEDSPNFILYFSQWHLSLMRALFQQEMPQRFHTQGQQRQCAQKHCQVYAETIVSSWRHYFWQSHPCWRPPSMSNGHHIFSGYHNSHHNNNLRIGRHWCEPHTNHATYPLLPYNDEQHTFDKDHAICSIGTNWKINITLLWWTFLMTLHCQIISAVVKIHTTTPNFKTVRNNKLHIGILCHCPKGKSPAAAIIHRMTPQLRRPFVTFNATSPSSWDGNGAKQ